MARSGKDRTTSAGEAFWRFSLALYARPAVAAALLALQDRGGRDVNLMLYALWCGAVHGRRLGGADITAAVTAIAPVGPAVVAKLRDLRRKLRRGDDFLLQGLRRRIAAWELLGEQCAQYRLAECISAAPGTAGEDRLAAAIANLALYLDRERGSAEAAVLRTALAELMRHPPIEQAPA
jgi:uncharacterized protein (TIGR02444 family)